MALITVAGVALPTPSSYGVGIQDLSKAERNAKGTMIIERIATKRTIQIEYKYLSKDDLSKVLKALSGTYFNVTYLDPQINGNRTASFYCGDRSMGMIDFVDGIPRYKDIQFNLIER
jgi:hypothetical protein